jgi:hypothetical protein
MSECEGHYDLVKATLEKSQQQVGWKNRYQAHFTKIADQIGQHDWTIKTYLTIESPFGAGRFELDLKSDRSIWILDYQASSNPTTSPELSVLSQWSQIAGWKIPQPSAPLVKTNIQMWRYMWETLLVDSDFLDDRFGVRKSLDMRDHPKTPMEIAEEEEEYEGLSPEAKAERKKAWQARLDLEKAVKQESSE